MVKTLRCLTPRWPGDCRRHRRGVVYLMTLGTAMIVALLGLAALMVGRIQRKQIEGFGDSAAAERYARAAIDMALFEIKHNEDWRSDMAGGVWEVDRPIGTGSYSFQAVDPTDGDLTDSDLDPVVVVGTGKSGAARHKLQVRIGVRLPGLRCLEPAIHADRDLVFDATIARSDHFFSANHDVEVKNNAEVFADVEAANQIKKGSGGVFHGSTTTAGDWPRQMPDLDTVFDYYLANGTPISIFDLPLWDANLLRNPGFEDMPLGVPWYVTGGQGFISTLDHTGNFSVGVLNRNSTSDTLAQDVTAQLQSGLTYHSEAWLRCQGTGGNFRIVLKLASTGDGEQIVPLSNWKTMNNSWRKITGDAVVSWNGSLKKAEWLIETDNRWDTFRMDDVVLREDAAPAGWYTIHRQLLSPASNPFGSGITNPQGIYILDCAGQNLSIRDSRIAGTLVLVNQDNLMKSRVEGSVNWSPAVISTDPSIPNLPALVAERKIELSLDSTNLDEAQVNVNFNPEGTPYHGATDTDKADVYPAVIQGVVYSKQKIDLRNSPRFDGVVVSHDDIKPKGADVEVKYDPIYFEQNAPPGFRDNPEFYIVPGSFKRVVD